MRDYISSLVRQTINEFLKNEDQQLHIIISITNDKCDIQEISRHIEALSYQYRITLLLSKKYEELETLRNIAEVMYMDHLDESEVDKISKKIDLVYFPAISRDFLARLSLLLDDSLPVWFVLEMIAKGKEVLLGTDYIRKSDYLPLWGPSYIERTIDYYMKELKQNGVHFSSMEQATLKVQEIFQELPNKKPILLAMQVEEAVKVGMKEIKLPKNCIITPMARDVARELQIEIKEETDEGKRDDL